MIMREGELLGMGRSVREDLSEEVIQQLSQRTSTVRCAKSILGLSIQEAEKGRQSLILKLCEPG